MRLDLAQQRISSEAPCPLGADERLLLCRSCVSLLSLLCAKESHTNDHGCPENIWIELRTAWRTAGLLYLFRLLDQGVLFSSDAVLTSIANAEQNQEGKKWECAAFASRMMHAPFVLRTRHTANHFLSLFAAFFISPSLLFKENTFPWL